MLDYLETKRTQSQMSAGDNPIDLPRDVSRFEDQPISGITDDALLRNLPI